MDKAHHPLGDEKFRCAVASGTSREQKQILRGGRPNDRIDACLALEIIDETWSYRKLESFVQCPVPHITIDKERASAGARKREGEIR